MATPPVFTSGAILTAAQMNAVGMWKVASGVLSTATTNFVGCFTSDYTNYRIVVDSIQTSGNTDVNFRLLSGTTPQSTGNNYAGAFTGLVDTGAADNRNSTGGNEGYSGFTNVGTFNVPIGAFVYDVYGPQLAQRTFFTINSIAHTGNFITRSGMVAHKLTTAYDGIQFFTGSAVTLGGTVTIYGYNK
jgi:hypothetical protein